MKIIKSAKLANANAKRESSKISSVYNIQVNLLNGSPFNLLDCKGKFILFVNVASKCGFTNQYKALQELSDAFKDKLVIIGSPCNQFGAQEQRDATAIQEFCSVNYGVDFPITEKLKVKGSNQHPLYAWLTSKDLNGRKNSSVKWNFQKYLVSPEGKLIDYYLSITKPDSKKITKHLK